MSRICQKTGGSSTAIKGSLVKDFPTTAAVISFSENATGIQATCLWAGDSRCYLLDAEGLKQLTEDDLGGFDAMENLSADGALTNVISLSKKFSVHHKTISISCPSILFTATDGCFGYLSTPMEFENLLIGTLSKSVSVIDWEKRLTDFLQEVAGDDFSLCGCSFGYDSFENLKNSFEPRRLYLHTEYTAGIEKKTAEEKMRLWRKYSVGYSQYLNSAQATSQNDACMDKEESYVTQPQPNGKKLSDSGRDGIKKLVIPTNAEVTEHKPDASEVSEEPIVFKKPTDLD